MMDGRLVFVGIIVLVVSSSVAFGSASFDDLDGRLAECGMVLKNLIGMPDSAIPRDLLKKCQAIAIFPRVLKIGFFMGIRSGQGVVVRRDPENGEWSSPVFFGLKSASFGPQIGAQRVDLVLLIMTEKGVESLLEEKLVLGADISIAAGPLGREASAETNLGFDAAVLSYSRSRGFFLGMSMTGASLEPDREANRVYHGNNITAQDVFFEQKGVLSDHAKILLETIRTVAR